MVELAEMAVLCQARIPRRDKVLKCWQWHFQFPYFEKKEKRKCSAYYVNVSISFIFSSMKTVFALPMANAFSATCNVR
ncbi:MAG: hypothetical protein HDR36_07195 [Treponema sp.]|nr:hypothetical protein [Treponema sp.]